MRRCFVPLTVVALLCLPFVSASADAGIQSVSNYAINWVAQTGTSEITAEIQAEYCTACNPNTAGNPGCTPFEHNPPPYGYQGCLSSYPDGTYAAVRLKDSGGAVLGTQKLILQQGVNLTLGDLCSWQFVFSGLPVAGGDIVNAEADLYCSWCGHWYADPDSVVIGYQSYVEYTGDLSALAGTNANVCAVLTDAATGDPLENKTITFTLNPPAPIGIVSAITDASGLACTTMLIPSGTAAGIYTMDTKFAGDAEYGPSEDQDPFEVIVKIIWGFDIKPGSCPSSVNTKSRGVTPMAWVGTIDLDVSEIDPASIWLENPMTGVTLGPPPIDYEYKDSTEPPAAGEPCFEEYPNYDSDGDGIPDTYIGDGYDELVFYYYTQDLAPLLTPVSADGEVVIIAHGLTWGGIPVEGEDVASIVK